MNKKWLLIMSVVLAVMLAAMICVCAIIWWSPEQEPPVTGESTTHTPTVQTTVPTQTTVPPTTQEPTQPPTEPPLPAYYNPFTGVRQDTPFTARPFLISINNNKRAMPFCGLGDADIVFEMLVNARSTRCLALVTDVHEIERIGAIRSLRYNFIDIAQAYDGIVVYASASDQVLADMRAAGVDNLNALSSKNGGAFYREQGRLESGYPREHTLFTIPGLMAQYAENCGYSTTTQEQMDYGFHFVQDATPADGETANTIAMSFFTGNKQTIMKYNPVTGRYQMHQYGADQIDGNSGRPLDFRNVFTLFAVNEDIGQYHVAQLLGSGDGYYACGGKIIPIKWYHEAEDVPFTFTLTDGTPLEQSIGNSYVGIIPTGSAFSYSD
ncbi:MAG: DUF3048 domain-containing protein [Oscillospiraceae bacterium]|nr:DUF3048 domain-containing protein [Oscillospiraceae bacterium]